MIENPSREGDLPPFRIAQCDVARREPGMMVFNVRPGGTGDLTGNFGWILGIDQAGRFGLNWRFETPTQDTCLLANGNLIFTLPGRGMVREATLSGESVRSWHAAAKYADASPPPGSIALDIPVLHHRINRLPSGNMLFMSAEMRELPDWPENDDDPNAKRVTARVVGDVVVEVTPGGEVVNRWAMLDMLDPYRLCYGSCSGYWRSRGFADSNDWCHANAVNFDARDDSILVSLRTQDCIIKFDRKSGELKWILGDHANWKSPWSEKLLKPVGPVEWQYHQHDVSVTPSGTILCFDNGNHRATPFAKKTPPSECYSRAVEFAVDEANMTVRQVWSYGDGPGERLYACFQGGAYRLPKTGNTFITYGGICTEDGVPTNDNIRGFCKIRLMEITPDKDIVFDMWIDGSDESRPVPMSAFRSEFIPPS